MLKLTFAAGKQNLQELAAKEADSKQKRDSERAERAKRANKYFDERKKERERARDAATESTTVSKPNENVAQDESKAEESK